MERMIGEARKVYERFKIPAKMIFDEDAKSLHESATVCFACKKRDHCHYTGKYRGAFHSGCNLKLGTKIFGHVQVHGQVTGGTGQNHNEVRAHGQVFYTGTTRVVDKEGGISVRLYDGFFEVGGDRTTSEGSL